ncbi:tetratricopeptide repeat protein [Halorubrum distributum]|uniref:tetratricopeptide repeat protein n=1 Tax=Halorubrum distributum TaxID=29283 RepID=UPI00295563D4|nr:tetratricopeptide repeat protein [Halorubrum distributum]MDV7350625.1 tetratricopeptide repeat protein [Halorubrum distributum]
MTDERDDDGHEFSSGQGVDADYDAFTLDPPELGEDPSRVDPVDSRVLTEELDRRNIGSEDVDVEQLIDVGLSYMGINRFEEATETFERAANFAEEDSLEAQEAWVNKGAAHAQLEEFDQAIGAYQEALRIDEESEHAATAETNLAYALWESGQGEQALEHAERAVETDPRFAEAWYNRGFLLVERGLAEDAVSCFDNAIRLGYRDAGVLEEKARALEEAGEHEQAEEVADQAEELRRETEEQMIEEQTGQAPGPGGQPPQGGRGGQGGAGGPGGQPGGRGGQGGRRGDRTGQDGEAEGPERELQGEGPEGF